MLYIGCLILFLLYCHNVLHIDALHRMFYIVLFLLYCHNVLCMHIVVLYLLYCCNYVMRTISEHIIALGMLLYCHSNMSCATVEYVIEMT